jgi:plasmid stability protein
LPDDLLRAAKVEAARKGLSIRQFFTEALREKLEQPRRKMRRPPPEVGAVDGPRIGILTAEQIDEAMFG